MISSPRREKKSRLRLTKTVILEDLVGKWQSRPLDPLYALVSLDALRVKMRDEGTVRNKAVYLAICVTPDGRKNVLGIWIEQTEGAKFWLRVMTVIRNRGTNDILIAIVDGLKGFPDAINAVFPETQIQTCIVHMTRNSLDFCSCKDRKLVAKELKTIYRAADATAAAAALQEFEDSPLGQKYAAIGQLWRRQWPQVIPFYAYPQEVRKMIYTTNAIESLNSTLRRAVRARGHFPNDEAATKLIWLRLRELTKNGKCPLANGAQLKHNSRWCSVIDFRCLNNQPAQHTKFMTGPLKQSRTSRRCCRLILCRFRQVRTYSIAYTEMARADADQRESGTSQWQSRDAP